jgi:hypothetical protein
VISESAWHALFARTMFIRPQRHHADIVVSFCPGRSEDQARLDARLFLRDSLAHPDLVATATFVGPRDLTIADVPLDFVWGIPEVRGFYKAVVSFPEAGGWSVSIRADGYQPTPPTLTMVGESTPMPQVGETPPAVPTRTSADHPLEAITTDPSPDPDFYRLSLDQALADGRPTVIVFATPAFCMSATCGPVLDIAKEVAANFPQVDFLHIEIYENLDAAGFDELVPVEAVEAWALPSEPWVFVTDAAGVVTARFEGVVSVDELVAALTALD